MSNPAISATLPFVTEQEALIGFSLLNGIGPVRFKLLFEYFGSAAKAFTADEAELQKIGLGGKLTAHFVSFRAQFNPQKYLDELEKKEISVLARADADFPKQLLEIPDPPLVLYVKGTLPKNWERAIGVVGTRKPTSYGKEITRKITAELASWGSLIVSGLARGVDGIAHRTALEYSAITVAVLGCGVDIIYPPEHGPLYHEILQKGGAVISEVAPGHTVLKGLFPARNRIISGLCRGIVVTEGAEDSGSLITARFAAEQGRDVFAVPGPVTSFLSAGPAKLIKQGAKLITCAADILEEYDVRISNKQINKFQMSNRNIEGLKLNSEQKKVLELLMYNGQMHYDELVRQSGLPTSSVGAILTSLELGGIICGLGDGKYSRA